MTSRIVVRKIKVSPPSQYSSRRPLKCTPENQLFLAQEAHLRKVAFASLPVGKSDAFYSDEDLNHPFFLFGVFEQRTNTLLLSCRCYTNLGDIEKSVQSKNQNLVDLDKYENGQLFLADRLSANSTHPLFIAHRKRIFRRFYLGIQQVYQGADFLLMARSENPEKLLTKYVRLGLNIQGSVQHHGIKHWVLLGSIQKSKEMMWNYTKLYGLVLLSKLKWLR